MTDYDGREEYERALEELENLRKDVIKLKKERDLLQAALKACQELLIAYGERLVEKETK